MTRYNKTTSLAAVRIFLAVIRAHQHARPTALLLAAALLVGCGTTSTPNLLDPHGPVAAQISNLWWLMFWLGLAVYIVVFALALYATFRTRGTESNEDPSGSGRRMVVLGGVIFPLPILAIVLGYTMYSGSLIARLSFSPVSEAPSALTIDVIGHQFWWEVRYPDQEVVTANEIHIPIDEPVLFRVTSADVIHSFWVPQLNGKIDLNPGDTNAIWLEADEPGIYRGLCAEFCGLQHAHMQFLVIAQPAEEFVAWVERQRQPAEEPTDPVTRQGQQVFMGSACVYCHTIQGLNPEAATEVVAPDLTHLASRLTIAAGM
ncbi:MAG: cytochrome c oxidase subunit II, partial [Chloroflexota bacterium]|nr:cytochrome c oxidase subunit II [Chloroflexota bacterium]